MLGDLYRETGESDFAIGILSEGVRVLTPIFTTVPAVAAELMGGVLQSYLLQCEVIGREPDKELLGPVISEFERLNAAEEVK